MMSLTHRFGNLGNNGYLCLLKKLRIFIYTTVYKSSQDSQGSQEQ